MVMQVSTWRRRITDRVGALSEYTPDMFVKCQWQRSSGISVYYLVYRCVIALVFISILFASIAGMGRPKGDVYHYLKWAIYLTHWGFLMCTLQALLAAFIITKTKYQQPDLEPEMMKMSRTLRVYWTLHSMSTVGAFCITAIYWLFVFNPKENKVDALNLLMHVGNSLLTLTDLMMVSHPIRLLDFYWPVSFSLLYVLFNFLYYEAGGTDRKGRHYIYGILDWERPGRALVVVQACLLLVMLVHLSVFTLSLARSKLGAVWRTRQATITETTSLKRSRDLQGKTNEIPINDLV